MIYAGIDVHRKRSQVSLIDGDGKELLNRNVDNGSGAMLDILEDLEPGTPVANSIGAMATIATPSVSSFGRKRWTAPSMTACRSSSSEPIPSRPPRLAMASRR